MTTAWRVDYGPAHNLQPLMKALLRMPGIRTQITETLAHLDQNEEIDHAVVDLLLPEIAPHLSDKDRQQCWITYLGWLALRDGVEAGTVHWSEVEPALTGPHRSEDAFDIARDQAGMALRDLIGTVR